MSLTFTPLNDRVLVKRIEAKTQTPGGLLIPAAAAEKMQEFTVVSVGPGLLEDGVRQPMPVTAGDRVLLGKYSGGIIKLDGEEFLVVEAHQILGILS